MNESNSDKGESFKSPIVLVRATTLPEKHDKHISSSLKSKKSYVEDFDEILDDQVNFRNIKKASQRLVSLGMDDQFITKQAPPEMRFD